MDQHQTHDEPHVWDDVMTDLDRAVYGNAYARPLPRPRRPALLLIDYYNAVFGDRPESVLEALPRFPSSCGLAAWEALPFAEQLMAAARQSSAPIFYTTGETRPESQPQLANATKRKGSGRTNWDMAIVDSLSPRPGDTVIYKQRASAFFGTPLSAHLVQLGVDGLVVAGESTSGCVRASVVDAYSHGFPVLLAEEATFDRSLTSHKVNLFDMHHKYAWVVKTSNASEALSRWEPSPE
ncbi:MAG: isochorismatase family protein [Chloroflexota bacterium]